MAHPIFRIVPMALAAALAACASPFGLEPGASREQVVSRMGRPTGVVKLPQGERLQYSTQPAGVPAAQHAWMADFGPDGRLLRVYQALTGPNFQRIVPGQWTRAQVEQEFGPPAWIDRTHYWRGPIMTYAWTDEITDKFFWVYLDEQGVVQQAHAGNDYRRLLPVP